MERKFKILLVDDDRFSYMTLSAILKRCIDPEIFEATNVDEALILLKSEAIDCIVSDFDMPGDNGYILARHAFDMNLNIPFIFYTGSYMHPRLLEYKGVNFPIIQKPFLKELIEAIKTQLLHPSLSFTEVYYK